MHRVGYIASGIRYCAHGPNLLTGALLNSSGPHLKNVDNTC